MYVIPYPFNISEVPMNLLFYRYGSICEPDIIEGFRELGNQVTEITLEIYNKNLGPPWRVLPL